MDPRRHSILGKVRAEKALTVSTPRMLPLRQCGSKHHSGAARSHSHGQKMGRRRKLYFMDRRLAEVEVAGAYPNDRVGTTGGKAADVASSIPQSQRR